ncbi:MAG: LysE family translocator [Desulfobacterales bacterium]|nr:LysE family translocator [Desulfobacterales bacterium]
MNVSFLSGLLLGLAAGVAPGPLLTLVVSQTLRFGTAEGLKVALAPLLTDLPIVLVSVLLLSRLADSGKVLGAISLAGSFYLGFLAWEALRTKPVKNDFSNADPKSWRRGALVNFLNPHPYLFWMTVGGPLILKGMEKDPSSPLLFVAGFYILLVGSKLLLAGIIGRYRGFLSSRAYVTVVRALGLVLAGIGLFLLRDAFRFLL